MSIQPPTYTHRGQTFEVEEDLYLGFKYRDVGSGSNLRLNVSASKSVDFNYVGGYQGAGDRFYAQSGEQLGNEGFSYQIGNNDPVFIPRALTVQNSGYVYFEFNDPRVGATNQEIEIPNSEIPDTGDVDIRIWSSDENHRPRTRLTGFELHNSSTQLSKVIESKIPVTEDLIELDIRGPLEVPSLQRARNLQLLYLSSCNGTEFNFNGLTKLRQINVGNCDEVTKVSCENLDECIRITMYGNDNLESVNISDCFNLQYCSINNNPLLASIRCVDIFIKTGFVGYANTLYVSDLSMKSNNLGAEALNQIYRDLADTTGERDFTIEPQFINYYGATPYGVLDVTGNPGSASDDPSTATAKNWIVSGT